MPPLSVRIIDPRLECERSSAPANFFVDRGPRGSGASAKWKSVSQLRALELGENMPVEVTDFRRKGMACIHNE